jgi:hypothetical protein
MIPEMRQARVFVSYSSADHELIARLVDHLGPLRDDLALIDLFWDQDLRGGDPWRRLIGERLEAADLVVLGVSASFFASPHCRAEMARALERQEAGQARVVPVLMHAVDLDATPLRALSWLPRGHLAIGDDPEHAEPHFAAVAREIRRLAEAGAAKPAATSPLPLASGKPPWHPTEPSRGARRRYLRIVEALLASAFLLLATLSYRYSRLDADLRQALSPVANPQILDLAITRGATSEAVADPTLPTYLTIQDLAGDSRGAPAYRAIIRDGAGVLRWQTDNLHSRQGFIAIDLPAHSLPEGRYTVEVFSTLPTQRTSGTTFPFELRR